MGVKCPLCGSECSEGLPIGKALKVARVGAGLSREALAEIMGFDVGTIKRWEYGWNEPQPAHRKVLRDWIGGREN